MTAREDFRLNEFYRLTDRDLVLIKKASSDPLHKDDWEKSCLKSFKKRVVEFLAPRQQRLCAYCRKKINVGTSYNTIDHIAPKAVYSRWMFKAENFCLACVKCNSHKNNAPIISDANIDEYPADSDSFDIINPYHDTYSEHIEFVEDLFYKGKTQKGRKTIEICALTRYELILDRVDELTTITPGLSFAQIIPILERHHDSIVEYDKLMKEIKQIIEHFII